MSTTRVMFQLLFASVAALILPAVAGAANVQVVCPGGGPAAYPSINAAIAALDPHGPNTITVSGTCVENIFLDKHERLVITSAHGQAATIAAADPGQIVFQLFGSQGITLTGLTFQGGSVGVLLNQGSNATIIDCTMQQNSGDGLHMQMGSTLVMENSTIQDNGGDGPSVSANSNATLATYPNQTNHVQRNRSGISLDGSYLQVNFGTLDVENNNAFAILQNGGRLLIFGGGGGIGGTNLFQGNHYAGIYVNQGGSAQIYGRNVIRNNGSFGVYAQASSVEFDDGGTLADGTRAVTLIQGHPAGGVRILLLGQLLMLGGHQILNNGSAGANVFERGGVVVTRGSLSLANGVQVSNNVGPGIRAGFNSGSFLAGVTISNNSEDGVRVELQTVGDFAAPLSIAGNGRASISCDESSLIYGDLKALPGIRCENISPANSVQ